MEVQIPNLFIVGAMKAGTTSIYRYLKSHPQVYMCPIKEPNFFATDIRLDHFAHRFRPRPINVARFVEGAMDTEVHWAKVDDWATYLKLFRQVNDRQTVVGEASTSYLYSTTAAANIHAACPDARIIILLRNPTDRAYSHFRMELAIGRTTDSFIDAVKKDHGADLNGWGASSLFIEIGQYFQQVKRFYDIFGRDRIKVFLFEDVINRRQESLKELAVFLGIDENGFSDTAAIHNPGLSPRYPLLNYLLQQSRLKHFIRQMTPRSVVERCKTVYYSRTKKVALSREERSYLQSFFREDIENLSKLLQMNLSHWLA